MLWSNDASPVAAFFLAMVMAAFLAESFFLSVIVNVVMQTKVTRYLGTSVLVGFVSSLVTLAVILYLPGGIVSHNEEPGNVRTVLWDHALTVTAISVAVFILLVQFILRSRHRKRFE